MTCTDICNCYARVRDLLEVHRNVVVTRDYNLTFVLVIAIIHT
jgi:hypothetical protein